jgi:hypothetical protein
MASNINPNNIDGNYPVAGQDNNSQGFRDNFTNTRTNFQFAQEEINDLQNKVVLKAPLAGLALDNNMNDNLLLAARIQDFSATKVTITPVGSPLTALINYANGHYQSFSTTAPTTLSFQGFPDSPHYGYVKIQINITNVVHTITLPSSVSLGLAGIQGISPGVAGVSNTITFSTTGVYEFAFGTYDAGSTITLFDLNRALTDFSAASLNLTSVTTSGFISAAGNITGGNISSTGLMSSSGNITGGNISSTGLMSSSGNITGGNINTSGTVTSSSVTGSIISGSIRPATGGGVVVPLQFTSGTNLATPPAGSFEYDGNAIYSSPSQGRRGISVSEMLICLSANYTALDSSAAQKVFNNPTNGAISVAGSTAYMFEAMYYISRSAGAVSHTMGVLFGGTATIVGNGITYIAETTSNTAGNQLAAVKRIAGTALTEVVCTDISTLTNEFITVNLRGVIRINAAGTLIPQIKYSAAPGGAPVILANSYFKLMPIGSSSVTSVGAWS